MKVYHVMVERDETWYVARALEDGAVFTQGQSFDEIIQNIREVVDLLYREKDVQVELIVPPEVFAGRSPVKRNGRATASRKLPAASRARR